MGRLLILCPDTGKAVPTGTYLDSQILAEEDVTRGTLTGCPACGGRHEFTDDDTFMETDDDGVVVGD